MIPKKPTPYAANEVTVCPGQIDDFPVLKWPNSGRPKPSNYYGQLPIMISIKEGGLLKRYVCETVNEIDSFMRYFLNVFKKIKSDIDAQPKITKWSKSSLKKRVLQMHSVPYGHYSYIESNPVHALTPALKFLPITEPLLDAPPLFSGQVTNPQHFSPFENSDSISNGATDEAPYVPHDVFVPGEVLPMCSNIFEGDIPELNTLTGTIDTSRCLVDGLSQFISNTEDSNQSSEPLTSTTVHGHGSSAYPVVQGCVPRQLSESSSFVPNYARGKTQYLAGADLSSPMKLSGEKPRNKR